MIICKTNDRKIFLNFIRYSCHNMNLQSDWDYKWIYQLKWSVTINYYLDRFFGNLMGFFSNYNSTEGSSGLKNLLYNKNLSVYDIFYHHY